MVRDPYDYFSLMLSWRWPKAEGEITAVQLRTVPYSDRGGNRLGLVVEYKFSVGDDGPYSAETCWSPWFGHTEVTDINNRLRAGQSVTVRYPPDDPSASSWSAAYGNSLTDFRYA